MNTHTSRWLPNICIVVPCFNEEEVLPETVARLRALLAELESAQTISPQSSIVFIDDGSSDRTWELIARYAEQDPHVNGIKLSRNHGHQQALLAGLHNAPGDAVISVDADLQDDLGVIPEMIRKFVAGHDVVYGVRDDRTSDSFLKRWTAESYYHLLNKLGVKVVFNHADYRLLSRRALDSLRDFKEVNLFLRGIVPLLGYRSAIVPYTRHSRFAGQSKYPLSKMIALAINGVTAFSATPLRFITAVGLTVSLLSIAISLWALWLRLFTDDTVPGWTSIVVPLLILSGVQLLALGVIGEYVAKAYLETKRRPPYILDEMIGRNFTDRRSAEASARSIRELNAPEREELLRLRYELEQLRHPVLTER
jgi:glycosyltransferase involved in cell wall biosynthesis